jgi:ADP-ribose pyrophosphatase YjhB (NUDIX family)
MIDFHLIQRKILKNLAYSKSARYTEIKGDIHSSKFAFHLNELVKNKMVKKRGRNYFLTNKAIALIPYLDDEMRLIYHPIPSILCILKKGNKVLLRKRLKEPFKNYYGLISGVQIKGKGILESAEEIIKQKAGVKALKTKLVGVIENFTEDGNITYHYHLFIILCKEFEGELKKKTVGGNNEWVENIRGKKMIPNAKLAVERIDEKRFFTLTTEVDQNEKSLILKQANSMET